MDKQEIQEIVKQALLAERRRQFRKKIILIAAFAIFMPPLLYAASIAIPNSFSDGDTLSAAKLNDNFNTLLAKVNSLDAQLNSGKTWQLICEIQIGTNVTSVDTSTSGCVLNGDSDIEYQITYKVRSGVSSGYILLRPNNDSTTTNFLMRGIWNAAATANGDNNNYGAGFYLGHNTVVNDFTQGLAYLYAKTGANRILTTTGNGDTSNTVHTVMSYSTDWLNSASNLTNLTLLSTTASGIGAGSIIAIWARR